MNIMFRPPTDGYEERPCKDTLIETLLYKPSVTHPLQLDHDFALRSLEKGDVVIIERGRDPHHRCVGLIDYQGEQFLALLHWHNNRWYLQTDTNQGLVTEDMQLIGVATFSAKNLLK